MKVFSLASVSATIQNDDYGNTTVGGEQLISIGGGGKLIETISYSFQNDMFTLSSTADGGAVVAHNASKAATVTFQIQQTSPHIITLSEFYKWCWAKPESAQSKLTVRDNTGNIAFEATGVFPSRFPDNSVGNTATQRTFTFVCAELIPQESNIG